MSEPPGTQIRHSWNSGPSSIVSNIMWNWIMVAALYLLGMGFFALVGGVRAAGDAFRRWGESASHRRRRLSPSS
jgi:hypothetical protein